MILSSSEIAEIAGALRAELLPLVLEQLRVEGAEQMTRQLRQALHRTNEPRLLRLPEVCARVGYKSSKVWELAKQGLFPQAVKLGPRVSAWREHEISEWVREHAA